MKTVTLKIDEKTTSGKAVMTAIQKAEKVSAVIVVKGVLGKPTIVAKRNYSPQFVSLIKKGEQEIKSGKTKKIDPNKPWESLKLK